MNANQPSHQTNGFETPQPLLSGECGARKPCERDITAIVDGQSQADPQFRTNRLYTRLTATEVRRQLIEQKGYREDGLPTAETISTKLNALGYYPKKVAKS